VRVGEEPAKTERWSRATNYKAVGLWSGGGAIPFMKALKDNARLAVRIQDKDRVDAEFDLGNVSAQVEKIRDHCKW
jgi:type VI secretion system protein VasI